MRTAAFMDAYVEWERGFPHGHMGMAGCVGCANTHQTGCPNYDRPTDYQKWKAAWLSGRRTNPEPKP